jgi:GTPase
MGEKARRDLEKLFNKKVFIKRWVKIKKNWKNDSDFICSIGIGSLYE